MKRNKGSALMVAVIVIFVVGALAVAMTSQSFFQGKTTATGIFQEQALQIAEAGLAVAIEEINGNVDYDGNGVGNASGNFGSGSYQVTASQSGNSFTLRSIGSFDNGKVRKGAEVILEPKVIQLFPYTMMGDLGLTVNGTAWTDSYDSRNGTYATQATNIDSNGQAYANVKGHVRSNGDVTVTGNSSIHGDAIVGPDGTLTITGQPLVTGSTNPATTTIPLPVPTYSPPNIANPQFRLNGGSRTISTGTHRYSSWSQSGSSVVTLSGEVTLYIDGDMSVAGQASIVLEPSAKVTIHHGTGSISIGGGGIVNASLLPTSLLIYSSSTTGNGHSFSGTSAFYGAVYSPGVDVTISGISEAYGAFVGKEIKVTGTPNFHYDEALGQLTIEDGTYAPKYWHEFIP